MSDMPFYVCWIHTHEQWFIRIPRDLVEVTFCCPNEKENLVHANCEGLSDTSYLLQ